MSELLRPHGSFAFSQERGVFILDIQGPWNREAFDNYVAVQQGRMSIRPPRWGGYVRIQGEALCVPELVPLWRENNAQLAQAGLVAVAYRFLDTDCAPFYELVFRDALGEAPFEVTFVPDDEAAMAWLEARGLVLPPK